MNTTSPIDVSNAQYNSSTSTVSNAGVTTTAVNDMLVFAVGITVPTTVNVPAGFHEEWSTTSTTSTTSEMSDMIEATTGATGTISGSHNGGANSNITYVIALMPASAPVGVTAANLTYDFNTTGATSYTTASISPAANKLYILTVANKIPSAGTPNTPTVTGAGMTWTQIATRRDTSSGDNGRRITMFRALSASPGSGALTIDLGGQTQGNCAWSVDEFSNIDTTGTNGSGAIVQEADNDVTGTLTSSSVTLAALGSPNNAVYGGGRFGGTVIVNPGSSFRQLSNKGAGGNSFESEWAINQTTVNWTFPSDLGTFLMMALEIKAH